MKDFFILFALQFLLYFIVTLDYRAVAMKKYGWVLWTNTVLPYLGYKFTKVVTADQSAWGITAVMLAGATASVLGIYLTSHWENVDGKHQPPAA